MKNKRLFRKIITLLLSFTVFIAGFSIYQSQRPSTVRAFGDLTVDFHTVLPGDPIFEVANMAPGDAEDRDVDVTNTGTVDRFVAVKGLRTGGVGTDPKLETVLDVVISEGGNDLYGGTSPTGPKSVQEFFDDSGDPNGIPLSILPDGDTTTYNIEVTFPTSAGNPFQGKSVIFDLTFGIITGESLVINEVYYLVDSDHGLDSPKDRGISNIIAQNINTGPGSTNIAKVKIKNICKILQQNNSNINNNVNINTNTGGNSASGNTGGGSIVTGAINAVVNIFNGGNSNTASCAKKLGQNDEWIEVYNPTDQEISLKNWRLVDNSGVETIIHPNKKVPAGGFALISKDASLWTLWNEDPSAQKVELGSQIGDGLDNGGDHIFLKNPAGDTVDAVSWGSDTAVWNPAVGLVSLGASIERLVPGFDTDQPEDWEERDPPTPGN